MSKGIVYILHFSKPYKHAKHYVGYCNSIKNFDNRLQDHISGNGATLTKVVSRAGINIVVASIIRNQTRYDERILKNKKNTPKYCPICKENEPI